MSYEHIEHEIKLNLTRLHLEHESVWVIPDTFFDQALELSYKQGVVDGGKAVCSIVDRACESVQRGESHD